MDEIWKQIIFQFSVSTKFDQGYYGDTDLCYVILSTQHWKKYFFCQLSYQTKLQYFWRVAHVGAHEGWGGGVTLYKSGISEKPYFFNPKDVYFDMGYTQINVITYFWKN